jgi:cyclase
VASVVRSERFHIEPVGAGVWAALGNRSAGVTSNAGIVDLGNVTLIVDSFLTPQAAQELRTASRLLTGRDPSAMVNTHWHFDHCLGNSVFRDCEIYSTGETRERLLDQGAKFLPSVQGDAGAQRIRQLEALAAAESRPLYREEVESELAARRDLYEMYRSLEVFAPNQVYETRYNLPARGSAWFVEVHGHTGSETMVFVPDAEVLFTGDIVVSGVHPNLASGDLEPWKAALAAVHKIAPGRIVPGHGPVGGPAAAAPVQEYLGRLTALSAMPEPTEIPERYASWLSPSQFESNLRALRSQVEPA